MPLKLKRDMCRNVFRVIRDDAGFVGRDLQLGFNERAGPSLDWLVSCFKPQR